MSSRSPAGQIVRSLVEFRHWWLFPTLVCTLLAIFYALFAAKTYTSHQTLVVRDDLVGTFFKPGRFDSLDSMKSAQETILEISRRPGVIRSALKQLGPPGFRSETSWLSDESIQDTQGKIEISAPNGAEFGRTEAIILSVKASTRDRSKSFLSFLLDEIETNLRDFRSQQFSSMAAELEQAARIAESSYVNSAKELKSFEKKVGSDLITLISMNESQAGTNVLQTELANLNSEQRKAWANLQDVKKQIQILTDVKQNPESLLEVPQELLQLQPTLASLAKGLNDAILKYSTSKGRYQLPHPRVREDQRAVQDIKQRINDKLVRTLGSLNYQLELRQGKYDQVTRLVEEKKLRLGELSGMRVDHETLKSEVAKKREINGKAQANLSEIQSLGSAANEVNLISRIDEPQTDVYADGPSKKLIVFGGMIAGLMIGLGFVMFVAPLDDFTQDSDGFDPAGSTASHGPQRPNRPTREPAASPRPATAGLVDSSVASSPAQVRPPEEPAPKPARTATTQYGGGRSMTEIIDQSKRAKQQSELSTGSTARTVADSVEQPPANSPEVQIPTIEVPQEHSNVQAEQVADYSLTVEPTELSEVVRPDNASQFAPPIPAEQQYDAQAEPVDSQFEGPTTQIDYSPPEMTDSQSFVGWIENDGANAEPPSHVNEQDDSYDPYQRILASLPDLPTDDSTNPQAAANPDISSIQDALNMPISENPHMTVAEKINQLDQVEQRDQNTFQPGIEPITSGAATAAEALADDPPSASDQSAGLPLTTSIQNSSDATTIGYESDPNTGTEPDNRPTAIPVDLDMLRSQIAARSGDAKTPKTLTDVLSSCKTEVPEDDQQKHEAVDQSMADLAKSIRDMCKKLDEPES